MTKNREPPYSPDRYTVSRYPLGILVEGQIPLDDFLVLSKVWEELGYNTLDYRLAQSIHATFAITKKENVQNWRSQLGVDNEKNDDQ